MYESQRKYWKIWNMAQSDPAYRMMLLRLRKLDREFDRVMLSLDGEDRDTVSDFVSLCEEMSTRMLESPVKIWTFANKMTPERPKTAPGIAVFRTYSCSQLCQMFCTSSSSSMMSMSFSISLICSSLSSFW